MNRRIKDASILIFCVMTWALSFPVIKFLLMYFNPISLSFIRFSLASIALIPVFLVYKNALKEELRKMPLLFLMFSILVVPLPDLSQNFGIRMMDPESAASIASILQPMSPVFVLILATVILREKFTLHKGIGVSLSFLGAILLSTDGFSHFKPANMYGGSLILLSGFSYALSGIYGKKILNRVRDRIIGPMAAVIWSYFFGSIFLLPFFLLEGDFPEMRMEIIAPLLFLSIFTLIPYFLWYLVLRENEVSRQSAYVFMIPMFGVLFSALLLDEKVSISMLFYGSIIIAGVYVAQIRGD